MLSREPKAGRPDLELRTRAFALAVIKVVESLPHTRTCDVMARQLLRCGTSVGANYRAARRAKSRADFIAKMEIVLEEADESLYWMQLLSDAGLQQGYALEQLKSEANQLISIATASIKTARAGRT